MYGFLEDHLTLPERLSPTYEVEIGYLKRPSATTANLIGNVAVDPAGTASMSILCVQYYDMQQFCTCYTRLQVPETTLREILDL